MIALLGRLLCKFGMMKIEASRVAMEVLAVPTNTMLHIMDYSPTSRLTKFGTFEEKAAAAATGEAGHGDVMSFMRRCIISKQLIIDSEPRETGISHTRSSL